MGTFRIEIEDGNEAFVDNLGGELSRILGDLARRIPDGLLDDLNYTSAPIRDINGNKVGFITYDNPPGSESVGPVHIPGWERESDARSVNELMQQAALAAESGDIASLQSLQTNCVHSWIQDEESRSAQTRMIDAFITLVDRREE